MSSKTQGGSWPMAGILAIVFTTLKLTGHIDWSWWWVLSPLWIVVLVVVAIMAIAVTVAAFAK